MGRIEFVLSFSLVAVFIGALFSLLTLDHSRSEIKPFFVQNISDMEDGSGVHITAGILTAGHVARSLGDLIQVSVDEGNGQSTYDAKVLKIDQSLDLALLSIPIKGGISVNCDDPPVGSEFTYRGYPGPIEGDVSFKGTFSSNAIEDDPWVSVRVVQMPMMPGMSGGGLTDSSGRLVGIGIGVPQYRLDVFAPHHKEPVAVTHQLLESTGYVVPGSAVCKFLAE